MLYTEIAFFIATGTITLSLFAYKILKYTIGIGIYSLYFIILITKINNIEYSLIASFLLTIITYIYYLEIGRNDQVSSILFVLISTIGLFFLSIFIIDVIDLITKECIYNIKTNPISPIYFNQLLKKCLN